MELTDPALLRLDAYVGGAWTAAANDARFAVRDPATGEVIAAVADLGPLDARAAVEAASRALPAWRGRTAKDRAGVLRRWFELIMGAREDLARLMTAEQGKPLAEARGEVAYGASFIEWFAEEGRRAYGDIIPTHAAGKRILVFKQPVGVVAAITPWNFPIAMITRKAGPALAAGCAFVIKPSDETPLCALALAELADRAGLPAGVFNVVPSTRAREIGLELTQNPAVAKLSFTGSTAVGRQLMAQCATTVKKVSLELGGNAPFVVFDDVDMDAPGGVIAGAIASKFRNMGQTCVCANRFLVQDGVHEAFVQRLSRAAGAFQVGPGADPHVTQGPLINARAVAKVERLLADAIRDGARVETGGRRHALGGCFFEPTVVTGVGPAMDISTEEIFGPVATITRFSTEAEAIALANDTPFGLAAYVYTRDVGRVFRMAEALDCGMVAVNDGLLSTEVAPFGGMKQSGLGREGSKYGIEDYLEIKYVLLGGIEAGS